LCLVVFKQASIMDIFIVIITSLIAFIAWKYKKFNDIRVVVEKIPGPPIKPFVGNALPFLGKSQTELLQMAADMLKQYGKTFRVMIGTKIQIMITDPLDVEVILSSQKLIDKADEYSFITEWLGTGLLISTGEKWFKRRKVITPAFHFKILEQFVETFDKHSATFVQNLAKSKGQVVDVFPLVTLCALDIICGELLLIHSAGFIVR